MPKARTIIDAQIWVSLSWVAVAVSTAALAWFVAGGRWHELIMASCFFLPFVLTMILPHGLPNLLVAIIAGCFLVSGLGWALDWYSLHWWFDIVLHTLNPFAMMAGVMFMLWKADLIGLRSPIRFVLTSTALGFLLGVAWEFVELTFLVLTWPDTILDIIMDTIGAAAGGWFAIWMIRARGLEPLGRRPLMPVARGALQPMPARVRPRR
jgi:hypothetical protein